jgi:hypothetical protein
MAQTAVTGQDNAAAAIALTGTKTNALGNAAANATPQLQNAAGALGEVDQRASDAAGDVERIRAHMQNLDGMTATVTIFIHTVGGGGLGAGYGGLSPGGSGSPFAQQGGEVFAGRTVNVGERGPEPFVPAVNGRILGHAETLAAMQRGGGGGSTNYFYGNVTLQVSKDTGAMLSTR